jgi:hypothetical protein
MREMIHMCGWISLIRSEEALLLAWNLDYILFEYNKVYITTSPESF